MTETASPSAPTRRGLLAGASAALVSACAPGRYAERAEARWPPEGEVAEIGGLRVHHLTMGPAEGPPIVLLHGATGNLRDLSFDLQPRLAAAGFRAIAFDRPGLGYTDRPPPEAEPWRPATQARLLRRAAARLGVGPGAVVLGHSWGAAVAMAWALQAQAEGAPVAGAVAVSGATMPWGEEESLLDTILDSAPAVAAKGAAARAMIGMDGGESVAARIFAPQAPPPGYIAHVGGPLTLRPASFRANAEDIDRLHGALLEQAAGYPGLAAPVIALHGDADAITSERVHARGMAMVLQRGEARVLPGIGHMLHHARPEAVVEAAQELAGV